MTWEEIARGIWRCLHRGRRHRSRSGLAPAYTESDLLGRLDEFNRAAESYWREIAADPVAHRHMLNKPFSTVTDTAGLLYRFGLVLAELDLGVGHTVLDFGAGSCWLSSSLNLLRCRTISVDVSPTALEIGRELFALDPRHDMAFDPQLLPFDGHRIPLPDESVDRIVCFDALHHVPNQDEILGELYRVLRTGGRAVFAEPGEGHAQAHQSVFETEKTGVLENDLDLEQLMAKVRKTGFDDLSIKPYPDPAALRLRGEDYLRLVEGDRRAFPMRDLQESLRHFYLFALTKGAPVIDSRNPRQLKAAIVPSESSISGQAGARRALSLTITNTGDTHWLHELTHAGGYVGVGGHLLNERRETVARGYVRGLLPRDLPPGESAEVVLDVWLPSVAGRHVLQLDMVDEWITWFEQCGSETAEVEINVDSYPDSRAPLRLSAEIAPQASEDLRSAPGARLTLPVRVENTGSTIWLHEPAGERGTVCLGGHLLADERVVSQDFVRCSVPRPVAPGESVDLVLSFAAPATQGLYRLRLDLVAEGLCWFEQHGSPVVDVAIETTDETPDSSHPGLLAAALVPSPQRIVARAGEVVELSVEAVNTGNTLWLHQERVEGGHVGLGGHLKDGQGRLLALDLFRSPLPEDVPPGGRVEVAARFEAPHTTGRYVVELDLVDERIDWFAARGSQTASLDLVVE